MEKLVVPNNAEAAQLAAVTEGLKRLGLGPENVVARVVKEEGYRNRTMYWIGATPSGDEPICCVGPLTATIELDGSYGDYFVEVTYNPLAEQFFNGYFRKGEGFRKREPYAAI